VEKGDPFSHKILQSTDSRSSLGQEQLVMERDPVSFSALSVNRADCIASKTVLWPTRPSRESLPAKLDAQLENSYEFSHLRIQCLIASTFYLRSRQAATISPQSSAVLTTLPCEVHANGWRAELDTDRPGACFQVNCCI